MGLKSDITVVSAYGRGNWLASRLVAQGWSVSLVDVSEQMGRWVAEDWEGPFGFFRSERLLQSQLQYLTVGESEELVDQGFTVWLKDGPIEMTGPLSSFALESRRVSQDVQKYLLSYDVLADDQRRFLKSQIKKTDFSTSWLAKLAHQLSSNLLLENDQAMEFGEPLPLFAPYYFRRAGKSGVERSLELCQKSGVKVLRSAEVKGIETSKGRVDGLKILRNSSEFLASKFLVWTLSSEESRAFSQQVGETLFPYGVLEPKWHWMRFRLSVKSDLLYPSLPTKLVMVEDLKQQWTHDNLMCLEKTVKEGEIDVWMRIPTRQRFHRAYVETIVERACKVISSRLSLPVSVTQMPQSYLYHQTEVGAPRHPVYDPEKFRKFRRQSFSNVFYDGPECWRGLDWHSQFCAQRSIEEKLLSRYKLAELTNPSDQISLG